MGIHFSCPFSHYNDIEDSLQSVLLSSISFGLDDAKTTVQSVGFNSRTFSPKILKSLGSGKMIIEGSVSFNRRQIETKISFMSRKQDKEDTVNKDINIQSSDCSSELIRQMSVLDPSNPKHEAAIKLQKVYKSFRTRRKLADCAVLIEQSWWKLLDFAELKRSSISYYDIEKHETAISRWSRARTRAAKVGKGLSKNDKAQKLALQHWLEAIDPRHRYGHNLHFYYVKWLHCQCREPFFYWLDIGEGKEVNIAEKCPRSKLQQQCIKYLGPMERKPYEVVMEEGKFIYKQNRQPLHTTYEHCGTKWIFVLSTSKTLYVGKKKKGTFQHSSFLAGGATIAAGRLVVENGILKAVWPHSGHYQPTEENFKDFISFLKENNVDLADVKMTPVDEEEESSLAEKRSSTHVRNSSEDDLTDTLNHVEAKKIDRIKDLTTSLEHPKSRRFFVSLHQEITNLEILRKVESLRLDCESSEEEMFILEHKEEKKEVEKVVDEYSMSFKKGMRSYQLGKQLSCKWTTGAGPRIGCVRDYPSALQVQALERVKLSPKNVVSHNKDEMMTSTKSSSLLVRMNSMKRDNQDCGVKSWLLCRGASLPIGRNVS